jgi:hypothetical protein
MGRYCSGCITLKVEESACVCRVLWDIDHLPLELHKLRSTDAKVDDLLHRLRWVLKHLVDIGTAAAGETSGE